MSESFRARLTGSFAVNALGAGAIFASQFFVAHYAGVESFGMFAVLFAWVQVFIVVTKLGFDSAAQRLIPQYLARSEYSLIKGVILGSGAIVAGAAIVGGSGLAAWAALSPQPDAMRHTAIAAAFLIPVLALIKLARGILLGFQLTVRAQLFDPLLIYTTWMLVIAADVSRGVELTPTRIMTQLAVVATLALLGYLIVIRAELPTAIRSVTARIRLRAWSEIAIPMLFAYGLVVLMTYTDTILIGFLLDTDQAGIYTVGARFAAAVSMPMAFLGAALGPVVSELVTKGDLQSLQTRLSETTRFGLLLAVPVAAVLGVGSDFILSIIGEAYTGGSAAMRVLIVAQLINVLVGPVGIVLLMSGQHRRVGRIFAVTAAINVLLNLVFIPLLGIIGAAVATACAIIFRNLVLRAHLAKVHRLDASVFRKT